MPTFKKNNRLLQERSHLTLEFPQSNNRVLRTFIPFLENPRIAEKGTANLNSYNLVGRAGELFSYAGAQSRRLNVTFNISFQHVIEVDAEEGITDKFRRQFNLFFTDRESAKAYFDLREEADIITLAAEDRGFSTPEERNRINEADSNERSDVTIQDALGMGRDHAATHRAYYRRIAGLSNNNAEVDGVSLGPAIAGEDAAAEARQADNNKHIDLVYCWLNLIRATVLNRADNTVYGPPIVRLTHGPMYGNVPCLVENYSVKVIEEAGYEAETLTPKRLEVTLNMVESRTGDFGKYAAGKVISGDNLTGWESIIGNNELDPHNGLISRDGADYAV